MILVVKEAPNLNPQSSRPSTSSWLRQAQIAGRLKFCKPSGQCTFLLALTRPPQARGLSSTRLHVTPLGSPSNWMVAPQSEVLAAENVHPDVVANEMVEVPVVTRMPVVDPPLPLVKRHRL
jgi:hypothetical protein